MECLILAVLAYSCSLYHVQEAAEKDELRNGIKDENALFVATNNFKVFPPSKKTFHNIFVDLIGC